MKGSACPKCKMYFPPYAKLSHRCGEPMTTPLEQRAREYSKKTTYLVTDSVPETDREFLCSVNEKRHERTYLDAVTVERQRILKALDDHPNMPSRHYMIDIIREQK